MKPKKPKVVTVKALIHKDHLTPKGRNAYLKAQHIVHGEHYHVGRIEVVFKKPTNPDFVPITISYVEPQ